jgi:hypothetical protein
MQGDLKRVRLRSASFEELTVVGIQFEDSAGEKGWHIIVLPEGLDYWVPGDGKFYGISGSIDRVQSLQVSANATKVEPGIKRVVEAALAEWR